MRAVITQALKLRNEQNLKIKQPLSALYLGTVFRKLIPYDSIIREELNVKEIVYLDEFDVLSCEYLALNLHTAGRQLKGDLSMVKSLCDGLSAVEHKNHISSVKKGNVILLTGYDNSIPADCFNILYKEKENIAKASDGSLVAINTEITPTLEAEGIYRVLLRQCQILRKEAGFAVSDRVAISFMTESKAIKAVIENYANEISRETLSEIRSIVEPVMQKEVNFDGNDTVYVSIE